jgi:16S rRNA (adenine1518-N6/adenine1519-N6)-dimethyltransferase
VTEQLISVKAKPKPRLSQNFLIAPEFPMEIAERLPLLGKSVLEIGAGTGFLTAELAKHAKTVTAVEVDPDLLSELKEQLAGAKNVKIKIADALEFDLSGYDCIFGALPYHLSSPLLFRILATGCPDAVLVLQKEFAERLCGAPGSKDWSRLSAMAQADYDATLVDVIPAHCFFPIPNVDSAIVHLTRKPLSKRVSLNAELVAALFQHKNQNVKKSLLHSAHALKIDETALSRFADSLPKELSSKRPRALTLSELSELSRLSLRLLVRKPGATSQSGSPERSVPVA